MATAAIVVVAACSSTHVSKIQKIFCGKNFSYPARISAQNRLINNNRSLESSGSELLIRRWKGAERTKMEQSNGLLVVPRAKARVGTEDFIVEPATNVKFRTSLKVPGGSSSLSLAGIGFREKKIAIISVKVYAAGLYVDATITSYLVAWSGKLESQIEQDNLFFNAVFEAPVEKSLQIVLVRDIDGETFWGALDEALSPRLKTKGAAEQKALEIFRETFQGRSLKRGTTIYLNWLKPSILLVSISSDGSPSVADVTIDSPVVAFALFDVYFGSHPVSLPLKKSVASGLASII